MLKKILKEIVAIVVGKQADEIVDLLDGKKYVNEFIIAKKLNLTINQTRNILYKISDHGLVSFIRKKDKKKGWYTYFWKIEVLKSLEFLKGMLAKKIEQINHQVKSRETKEFYTCGKCNVEFNEESALLHNFTCNECGNIFTRKDNAPVLKEFNKELEKLKRELVEIDDEITIEKEKIGKTKAKEAKKEEQLKKKISKKKSAERKVKRMEQKEAENRHTKKIISKKAKFPRKKIVRKVTKKKIKRTKKKSGKKKKK